VQREQVKLLLIGCDDGTIKLYMVPSLSLVATIKSQSKLIQSLSLHPHHMEDGEQPSLASASNEFPIYIFDLGRVPQVLVSPTIVLLVLRLIKVAWSPPHPGQAGLCLL
jgi:WD40 repeat protein